VVLVEELLGLAGGLELEHEDYGGNKPRHRHHQNDNARPRVQDEGGERLSEELLNLVALTILLVSRAGSQGLLGR